jgi:uroporphyrinogen-III synthase
LSGKRIVITRARDQAGELADKLAKMGATPLIIPAIRIAPLPDLHQLEQALSQLSSYDWLIFTSVNGVHVFADRWKASGEQQASLRNLRVAAVGPATAEAVRSLGAEVAFAPAEFVAEAIAAGLGNLQNSRVLLPQAAIARPTLVELLTQQGAQVDAIPVYQTLPVEISANDLTELRRGVDAVIFTSGSTVRNFVAALKEDDKASQQLRSTLIVCIGPQTAQAAHEADLPVGVVAEAHTTDGLVQSLLQHFQKEPA